jgi:hypothetical protein
MLVASLVLLSTPLPADTVRQFNLAEMTQRADKIYRGTVLSATADTVNVGGGELPVVTYRLQVEELFRGSFTTVKGAQLAEIRMLGKPKPVRQGNLQLNSALPRMPQMTVGETYLVFTTRPSAVGLSTTVGLGQGCFHISRRGKEELAVNEVNNSGLFRGMNMAAARAAAADPNAIPPSGPIPYSELARQIRAQLGQ